MPEQTRAVGRAASVSMPRITHLLVVCLALAALGLGLVAWRQDRELRRLTREQRSGLEPMHSAAIRGVAEVTDRAIAVRRTMGRPTEGWSENALAPATETVSPTPSAPARRRGGLARLLEDPAFRGALALQQEGALDARFAALFRRLGLTAEELAEFKRLLVERENVALDVVAIGRELPGDPLSVAAMQEGVRLAQAQIDAGIRGALGEARYAMYVDFVNTLAQRATVARVEQRLSYTDARLQPEQAEALVAILARHPGPPTTTPGRPLSTAAVAVLTSAAEPMPVVLPEPVPAPVSQEALTQAQAVLSPAQLAALQQVQAETDAAREAARAIRDRVHPPADALDNLTWLRLLAQ